MKRQRRAFTLIELLIVVAILAILAAMAVPNFLEAQTRSKVSKVKSDLRTVVVALECYFVDGNTYPNRPAIDYRPGLGTKYRARLAPLTSPVAYITSLPKDIFNPGVDAFSADGNDTFAYGVAVEGPSGASIRAYLAMYAMAMNYPNAEGVRWVVYSYGPLMDPMGNYSANPLNDIYYMDTVYDPTNGTVSPGIVARIGP